MSGGRFESVSPQHLHKARPRIGTRKPPPAARPATKPPAGSTTWLLGLQRSAGNQAVRRLVDDHRGAQVSTSAWVQRREHPDSVDESELDPQDWRVSDRVDNTQRWQDACEYNLDNLRNGEYTEVAQRRDFYKWFYEATAAKGYHTRWALAAYIVASGVADMAEVDWLEGASPITNDLQGLARIGNQVIFDDVLPKLKDLWDNGPVTGTDALRKDAEILAEEQNLVQAMYDDVSPDTMQRFERIANNAYWRTQGARSVGMGGTVEDGPFTSEGDVPTFSSVTGSGGDINRPEDRWKYGMELGGRFSTLPPYGSMASMPAVGSGYSSGAEFNRLNVRPNLHQLDARLNDANVPEDEVVGYLAALDATVEQPELMTDASRVQRLTYALSAEEMRRGIEGLSRVRLDHRLELMGGAVGNSWSRLDYKDVKQIILSAPSSELPLVHTEAWKRRFIGICDDDTIVEATRDLRLPAAAANQWIQEERSLF